LIAAEAAEVADRVRNEVAVERGDAFRRLLTMIIATRVASGLVEVLHSMNLLRSGWINGYRWAGVLAVSMSAQANGGKDMGGLLDYRATREKPVIFGKKIKIETAILFLSFFCKK
jgi:hypothetical protein